MYLFPLFIGVLLSSFTLLQVQAEQETCGLTKKDGINTFTIRSSSPNGEIPLIHVQFDTNRKLPVTSTVIYDKLNLQQNVERVDDFRLIDCGSLNEKQQNCADTMRLATSQKEKIDSEYNSWDRGHLTPVNPMRFSADAVNATYYCVNIAPQEPWSNRCPWYAVEERTLTRTKNNPSFVITGVCSGDNAVDGNTYYDLVVPDCFWKMTCYVDPVTKKTEVVAFIGNNTLIPAESKTQGRKERKEATVSPTSQQQVLDLMGSKSKLITSAWTAAEKVLTEGRDTTGLPKASTCSKTKTISDETIAEWKAFMKLHRPPFGCPK